MKYCKSDNCKKFASFNYNGVKEAIYCSKHKEFNMVDVIHKKCIYENCNTRPNFNYNNETIGLYCSKHKKSDMIDVINKKCIHENCNMRPSCNYDNETKPLYCGKHKKLDMVDVISRRCIHENCNTKPVFNYDNEIKPLYCGKHKKLDMVDVISRRCIHENCNTQPVFNYDNEINALYCFEHKQPDMVDVRNKRCIYENCNRRPIFKYNNYCFQCYRNIYPDNPITRNYKTKEFNVVEYIKTTFSQHNWIFDRQIPNGKSKYRPDIFLDMKSYVLIIEVDENQHLKYDTSTQEQRLIELCEDVSNKPIIFIRFNPDSYKINNKRIKSPWKINKISGLCHLSNNEEWEKRLLCLNETITPWFSQIPEKLTTINLFYDE
jgi:hypothetical protein